MEGERSETRKPDIYAALRLTTDQTRRAKDVLRIQTDKVRDLSRALGAQEVTLPEFKRQMQEIGQETDANLLTVFGDEKLDAWRKYQADQYPTP